VLSKFEQKRVDKSEKDYAADEGKEEEEESDAEVGVYDEDETEETYTPVSTPPLQMKSSTGAVGGSSLPDPVSPLPPLPPASACLSLASPAFPLPTDSSSHSPRPTTSPKAVTPAATMANDESVSHDPIPFLRTTPVVPAPPRTPNLEQDSKLLLPKSPLQGAVRPAQTVSKSPLQVTVRPAFKSPSKAASKPGPNPNDLANSLFAFDTFDS
jgi:hypothetical protein